MALRVLVYLSLAFAFPTFVLTARATAASLLVVQEVDDSNPVYRDMMERLQDVMLWRVRPHYERVETLKTSSVSGLRSASRIVAERMEALSRSDALDVLLMVPFKDGALAMAGERLAESWIRALDGKVRLRSVYMMGSGASALSPSWKAIGATTVIAHGEHAPPPGLYLPKFFKSLSQGASFVEADAVAAEHAARSGVVVRPFLRTENARSELASGQEFSQLMVQLLSAFLPMVPLDHGAFARPSHFVRRVGSVAWGSFQDSLGAHDVMTGSDTWVDGAEIQHYLMPLRTWMGGKLAPMMDEVLGARVLQVDGAIQLAFALKRSFKVDLLEVGESRSTGKPYRIDWPREFRMSVRLDGDVIRVEGLDSERHGPVAHVEIPRLADQVVLRKVWVNLQTGAIRIEAGVAKNKLVVIARGHLYAKTPFRIDIWTSIQQNIKALWLPLLAWAISGDAPLLDW